MFKKSLLGLLAFCMLAMGMTGCSSMNNTTKGTLIGSGAGAAVGAGVGALIGKNAKGTIIGAAIGTAVGAGTGAAIGKVMDNKAKRLAEQLAQQAAVETVEDTNGLKAIKVTFTSDITFATGKATVSAEATASLKQFAQTVSAEDLKNTAIQIKGHTDNTGSAAVNEKLSLQRAEAVGKILKDNNVSADRISEAGLSFNDPIDTNDTAAGRAKNRRVEVYILATEAMVQQYAQ